MLTLETKNKIKNARDVLVGKIPDPKGQVDQITNALIYKFMDDQDRLALSVPGGKASFFIGDLEKYAWHKLFDSRLSNQDKADLYIEGLHKLSAATKLPGLFRDIFKDAYLPFRAADTIALFLETINQFSYDHPEELGNAFEYLLQVMGSQGDAGQFRTPRHIIEFIVKVVEPKKDETIFDPACGTAGFLIEAFNQIKNGDKLSPQELQILANNIEGVDIDPGMAKIARVNLYLHGFKTPHITENDTLTNEKLWLNKKYDVILANPPFMTPKGGIRPHSKFSVKANRSEVLFVNYIIEHLKLNGHAGIIVPDGVLNTRGLDFSTIRKDLVNNGLYAVIDLPAGIFQPYSKVKTSILLIDKSLKTKNILFQKISPIEENKSFEINHDTKLNVDFVYKKIISYKKILADDKNIKPSKEGIILNKELLLASSSAFLKPEYYVDPSLIEVEGMVALGTILEKVSQKVGVNKNIPIMSITMEKGLIDQGEKFKKRIANIDISKYKLVKRNELVVGFPIDEGVLGFQTKYDLAAVSPAYDVWKIKRDDIPVEYLEKILRSKEAIDLYKLSMKGTANRRRVVPKDIFLSIQIPLPKNENLKKIVKKITSLQNENIELLDKISLNKKNINEEVSSLWLKS